jgi:hypothetical protein
MWTLLKPILMHVFYELFCAYCFNMYIAVLSIKHVGFVTEFKMTRRKVNDLVEGIVLGLLRQKMSYRKIVRKIK